MFNSPEFKQSWQEWVEHYEKKTLSKYSEVAERKAKSALFKKCDGREQLAIDSIDYSIEKNWSAIYLKPFDNGGASNSGSIKQQVSPKSGTSDARMEAARNW